jgi:hypothetical protein
MTSIAHRMFQQPWPEGEYRFFQLGFIVEDLYGTARRWAEVFGVGPFHVYRVESPCVYRGSDSAVDVEIGTAQAGPVQIELIKQHCDRASVYRDLFPKGESGFHQLCTVTADYDATSAHYARLGYDVPCEFVAPMRVAYVDTVADFGFYTEVVEETPGFLGRLANHANVCAAWDGTDPVRILTRDGYRTP